MNLDAVDFSMPLAVGLAFVHAVLFPVWLWLSSYVTALNEKHALRFLLSALIPPLGWLLSVIGIVAGSVPLDQWAIGLCVLAGALLFYLEVWGLMTRGYTLAILLTLLRVERPMSAQEIFDGYRNGEGLGWIMRHRLGGLAASGFVHHEGDQLTLSKGRGVFIARLQRICVAVLGLRRTG